jgi:pullulanase
MPKLFFSKLIKFSEFRFMRKLFLFLLLTIAVSQYILAQNETDYQIGYLQEKDSLYFLLSESDYNIKSDYFIVTGSFRAWAQDLNDKTWQLKPIGSGRWKLGIYNPRFEHVKPGSTFKFRTADGKWLDPPKQAPNAEGGNLVFMKGVEPFALVATILSNTDIEVQIKGLEELDKQHFDTSSFIINDASGRKIPIQRITKRLESKTLIFNLTPKGGIDKRRIYYLDFPKMKTKELISFDGWFKHLRSDKELGANINENESVTTFRVFSPRAIEVKIYLYQNKDDATPIEVQDLIADEQGVWEITFPKNLDGIWYDYTVHGFNDPGNLFFETHPVHISDPYARVSDDSFGKCRVVKKTIPAKPLANGRPKMEELLAYEVHLQDFTDKLPVASELKGTLPAMISPKLKNKRGEAIGFDYLCKLGINTVHLMPVQEMLHWPKDEWESAFKNDPYMIEQGIEKENYDWGYRTSHSFAIETRYRNAGSEPGKEREQFRDLVDAFHQKGIAVIVDFVFNHTAENMDGRNYLFHFNAFDKQYYYRTKNLEHIGAYGNETKSENRYMTQKWIIDQCKHFIEEFGVDGFRIDLAGQTDKQTLLRLKQELPSDIIIYGEPWIDSNDPEYNKNPDLHWYKEDAPICYFNDDTRNTYKGPVFELNSKEKDRGWAGGNETLREDVKRALTCSFPGQHTINSGINYLDIHDNFALADQFATYDFDGRFGVDEINYKIAATLLFTTPGPIVMHGGSEFMRSKGMAPLMEVEKEIPSGKIYFHGKRDTYNMRNANQFVWDNIGLVQINKKIGDRSKAIPYTNGDYKGMQAYWKGLIELRKRYLLNLPAYNENSGIAPVSAFKFIEPKYESILGYTIHDKVLILLNTGKQSLELEINLAPGKWKLVGNSNAIALDAGFAQYHQSMNGGAKKLLLEPTSIQIWVKD